MKKLLQNVLMLTVLLTSTAVFAQEKIIEVRVTNNRTNAQDVKAKITSVDMDNSGSSAAYNWFCWEICYNPGVLVSSGTLNIQPGAHTDAFSGHVETNGGTGDSEVIYCFEGSGGKSDTVCYIGKYNAVNADTVHAEIEFVPGPASITTFTEYKEVKAFPNPAMVKTTIAYSLESPSVNRQMVVRDMLGKVIEILPAKAAKGRVSLDLSSYESGVYYYSLEERGQILTTNKLVVR